MFLEMPNGDIINLANVIAVRATDYMHRIVIYADYDTHFIETADEENQHELMGRLHFLLHGVPSTACTSWAYVDNLILRTDKIRQIVPDEDGQGNKIVKIYADKYQFLIDTNAEQYMEELKKLLSRSCVGGPNNMYVKL